MAEQPTDQATERPSDRIRPHFVRNDHGRTMPRVDVLIVNSRGKSNPWLLAAINSVEVQSYPHIALLILDNNDHALSIGQAFNELVKLSTAEFVLFMGDDDLLTVDLVGSLLACLLHARKRSTAIVHATSACTGLFEQQQQTANIPLVHTGLFHREFLLNNKFNEAITKGIDLDMHARLDRFGKLRNSPITFTLTHTHGYVFRQHIGQVGGMRLQPVLPSPLSVAK